MSGAEQDGDKANGTSAWSGHILAALAVAGWTLLALTTSFYTPKLRDFYQEFIGSLDPLPILTRLAVCTPWYAYLSALGLVVASLVAKERLVEKMQTRRHLDIVAIVSAVVFFVGYVCAAFMPLMSLKGEMAR